MTRTRSNPRARRLALAAACAASAALVTAPGSARAERLELSVGASTIVTTSSSVDAISADGDLVRGAISAGWWLGQSGDLELGLFAAWEGGNLSGRTLQTVDTSLWVSEFRVGGAARRPLWRSVSGIAGAGFGLARGRLSLSSTSSASTPIESSDRAPTLSATAGLEAGLTSSRRIVSLAVRVAAGSYAPASFSFKADPAGHGGDELRIPTSAAPLGKIDVGGYSFGLSLVARY
jgi:hypothetical protein